MNRLVIDCYPNAARCCGPALLTVLMILVIAKPAGAEPRFEDYPATASLSGSPAPLDMSGDNWQRLRDHQRDQLKTEAVLEPNFAGAYRVVEIGCGTGCQTVVAIDLRSGKLVFAPDAASYGTTVRRDSRLLMYNADPVNKWEAGFYQLKDGIIRALK